MIEPRLRTQAGFPSHKTWQACLIQNAGAMNEKLSLLFNTVKLTFETLQMSFSGSGVIITWFWSIGIFNMFSRPSGNCRRIVACSRQLCWVARASTTGIHKAWFGLQTQRFFRAKISGLKETTDTWNKLQHSPHTCSHAATLACFIHQNYPEILNSQTTTQQGGRNPQWS